MIRGTAELLRCAGHARSQIRLISRGDPHTRQILCDFPGNRISPERTGQSGHEANELTYLVWRAGSSFAIGPLAFGRHDDGAGGWEERQWLDLREAASVNVLDRDGTQIDIRQAPNID